MKRKTLIWTLILAASAFGLGAVYFRRPLCWPEDEIEKWVVQRTPPGSSLADVKALIERQKWKLDFEWQATNSFTSASDYPYVRGRRVICAYLGHYQGIPWRADVEAFWGFDETGKVTDVHVRKCYDAP